MRIAAAGTFSVPFHPLLASFLACGSVDTAVWLPADDLIGSSPQTDGVKSMNDDANSFFLFLSRLRTMTMNKELIHDHFRH